MAKPIKKQIANANESPEKLAEQQLETKDTTLFKAMKALTPLQMVAMKELAAGNAIKLGTFEIGKSIPERGWLLISDHKFLVSEADVKAIRSCIPDLEVYEFNRLEGWKIVIPVGVRERAKEEIERFEKIQYPRDIRIGLQAAELAMDEGDPVNALMAIEALRVLRNWPIDSAKMLEKMSAEISSGSPDAAMARLAGALHTFRSEYEIAADKMGFRVSHEAEENVPNGRGYYFGPRQGDADDLNGPYRCQDDAWEACCVTNNIEMTSATAVEPAAALVMNLEKGWLTDEKINSALSTVIEAASENIKDIENGISRAVAEYGRTADKHVFDPKISYSTYSDQANRLLPVKLAALQTLESVKSRLLFVPDVQLANDGDNAGRAARINHVLHAHSMAIGDDPFEPEDVSSAPVAALIADIRHYCDAHDLDFSTVIEAANGHYKDENDFEMYAKLKLDDSSPSP